MNWSVIIPTLWKPKTFPELLERLQYESRVDEIIIIDNAPKNSPNIHFGAKVQRLEQDNNIFVNPAWNLGVEQAKNENICICNDDVLFDTEQLFGYLQENRPRGIIGIHPHSFHEETWNTDRPIPSKEIHIKQMWACLFFMQKSNYKPIPQKLKVWWGDAWLAWYSSQQSSLITCVKTKHSESVASPEFSKILEEDTDAWNNDLKPFGLRLQEWLVKTKKRIKNGINRRFENLLK